MNQQLFYNGTIITLTGENADAMLIQNGIIQAIGNIQELQKLITNQTIQTDLNGQCILPAFIDAHSHITSFAQTLCIASLSGVTCFDDIIQRLCDYKKEHQLSGDDWIVGFGYDHSHLKEGCHPTKNVLDQVSTTNPIVITHTSGHMGVMNSKALSLVNITNDTTDPSGGRIGRNPHSSEPNGYLEENAFSNATKNQTLVTETQWIQAIKKAQDIYLSYGITTAQEGLLNEENLAILKTMADQKQLKIDIVGFVDIKNYPHLIEKNKEHLHHYVHHLKIGGYKLFLDGSPQGKTAWMLEPYEGEDNYRGYPIYTDDEVESFITKSLEEGMQLLTHCNGDAAAKQLVQCFDQVVKTHNFSNTYRPVMIHAQTVQERELKNMKHLHMIPSFFVAHTYYWGDIHLKNLGKKRTMRISPARTAKDLGLMYTFHQDTPVILPNMFETISCAVNRKTKNGVFLDCNEDGTTECIDVLDALKAVTINAAYQYFEEKEKGSLEVGKVADFIIVNHNPFDTKEFDKKENTEKNVRSNEINFKESNRTDKFKKVRDDMNNKNIKKTNIIQDTQNIEILKTYKDGICLYEKS